MVTGGRRISRDEATMIIDGATTSSRPDGCADEAVQFEAMGMGAAWSFEGSHDPFLPLALAAVRTERIRLGTAIAIAFARNPMTCVVTAWDLQRLSKGRLILGLGTQIKPHITKRYSEPWSRPAARMGEFISALRAIWGAFETGERLDFRGEFYTHTLLPPFFNPGPIGYERPAVFVAGVGPKMMETIGAAADGFFVHPFHTPEFLRAETLPALAAGARSAGRQPEDVTIACLTIVAMGRNDEEVAKARHKAASQLAFYGSTPAYDGMLRHHGYEQLQPELNRLSKQGRWQEMTDLVDDDLIDLVAVSGTPEQVGARVRARNDFADRTTLMFYGPPSDPDAIAATVAAARG